MRGAIKESVLENRIIKSHKNASDMRKLLRRMANNVFVARNVELHLETKASSILSFDILLVRTSPTSDRDSNGGMKKSVDEIISRESHLVDKLD